MIVPLALLDWKVASLNLIWIAGIAIVLFYLSLWDFVRHDKGSKFGAIFSDRSTKVGLALGAAVVITGYAIAPNDWGLRTATQGIFVDLASYILSPGQAAVLGDEEPIALYRMEMIFNNPKDHPGRYPKDERFIIMPWNGAVGTPFFRFARGSYALDFEGAGTEAEGENARVYVYLVSWEDQRLRMEKMLEEIRFEKEPKIYSVRFDVTEEMIGKVRIQFFNDGGGAEGRGKDARVGGFRLKKVA